MDVTEVGRYGRKRLSVLPMMKRYWACVAVEIKYRMTRTANFTVGLLREILPVLSHTRQEAKPCLDREACELIEGSLLRSESKTRQLSFTLREFS